MDESKRQTINHPIPPLYDKDSRILILGSFPSVKSREAVFFYGHPQNRFWKTLSAVLSEAVPETIEEKSALLHRNHIAVWDVIQSCDIIGSSDSSIRNVVPNDISVILEEGNIQKIYCNGAKSYEYYKKYLEPVTGISAVKLPSTSPANAACSLEKLKNQWKVILEPLQVAPAGIGEVLLEWYSYNSRILPWRSDPTPYHVWISEIMLQQTRVEAVKRYYDRWMEALPDIKALSQVEDEVLMKLWEGLGYYNRVRNLKAAALTIMEDYGGQMPADYGQILSLKGIGEYTAGAISSIAFGLDQPAVDGNVLRVFTRILAMDGEISKSSVKKAITREVERVMPKGHAGDFNQALMDLGATVCLPNGAPLCDMCPWEASCQAHKAGKELMFPVKKAKKERRIEYKGVFFIEILAKEIAVEESQEEEKALSQIGEADRKKDTSKILLHKRDKIGLLPDLWEIPNMEGEFTMEKAVRQVESWKLPDYEITAMGEGKHIFSHVEWHMKGYHLTLQENPSLKELMEREGWIAVSREKLEKEYAVPSAFAKFL